MWLNAMCGVHPLLSCALEACKLSWLQSVMWQMSAALDWTCCLFLFTFLTARQNWSHLLSLEISHCSYIFTSCVFRPVAAQCCSFPSHCFMKMTSALHWTSLTVSYIKEPLCFSMPFLSAHLFFGHIFRKEILIASLCRKPSFQARPTWKNREWLV